MKKTLKLVAQFIPLILLSAVFIWLKVSGYEITPEIIIKYLKWPIWINALIIIGIYSVKSFIIIIPVLVLDVVSGMVFGYYLAVPIEIAGTFCLFSISYLIGRFTGMGLNVKKQFKNEKLNVFIEKNRRNEFVLSICLRFVGLIACDTVSMMCGAMKMKYRDYITGGLVGMLPTFLADSFIGASMVTGDSVQLIISVVIRIFTKLFGVLLYIFYFKSGKRIEA